MIAMLSKAKNKLLARLSPPHFAAQLSFSQSGEDMIAAELFRNLSIHAPEYLDLGASHPVRLSNTYHYYLRGCRGVVVEPHPELAELYRRQRPRDIVVHGAVAPTPGKITFYLLDPHTLSTTDETEMKRITSLGQASLKQTLSVNTSSMASLIRDHGLHPDRLMVSLDIEGGEEDIIRDHDFDHCAPLMFILETIKYAPDMSGRKRHDLISLMESKGYRTVADTRVNSVFLHESAFAITGHSVASVTAPATA